MRKMVAGVVDSWDGERGYGTFVMDDGEPVWAHYSTIRGITGFRNLIPGERVAMTLLARDPEATNTEAPGFAWITADIYPVERIPDESSDPLENRIAQLDRLVGIVPDDITLDEVRLERLRVEIDGTSDGHHASFSLESKWWPAAQNEGRLSDDN